ncbi:MAG: tRNA pseudouridine(38-40) synthase TruA [bacterium]|nr:tRNA pseudouridine(38-40) synthase TruA [bacterium]
MTHRLKLTIAYFGTPFHGWQRQRDKKTVQGELEQAVARGLDLDSPLVVGAGRTDAGVHARGQVAHVDLPSDIPIAKLGRILNRVLPPEIKVRRTRVVSDSFHARFHAHAKHYAYRILWTRPPMPWAGLRAAVHQEIAHADRLRRSLESLQGRWDVASFSVPSQTDTDTTRTLFRVWSDVQPRGMTLHFVGDGFLRYQVRRMVGALLEVGSGRRSIAEFDQLRNVPQPGAAIQTAPAVGLTLEQVYYRSTRYTTTMVDSGVQGSQNG